MLAEVQRATSHKEDVVFLGWAPHPMNVNFKIQYLTGGDDSFGPNFGGAIVYTNERAGFAAECPNAAKLDQEPGLHRRYRKRGDEQDPDRRQGRPGRGEGMAEDQPAGTRRLGSTASRPSTASPGLEAVKKSLGL